MVNLLHAFKVTPDGNGQLPPPETVNLRVIVLSLFGACAAMLFGYDLGFIGGVVTLPSFLKSFDQTDKSAAEVTAFASNVVSAFQAGAFFGALFSAFISDRIGRKRTLQLTIGFYIVGAVLMTASSGTAGLGLIYTGRVITGWGVGASTMLVPIYVAECSPAHIRGRLVGMYEVGVQFGTMWGFWVNYLTLKTQTGTNQWRIPIALQLIPSTVAFIGLFFLTETPRFLVKQGGELRALPTLAYLRGLPQDHPYVTQELTAIAAQIEHERAMLQGNETSAMIRETFSRRNARRLITGVLIMVGFQMAGTNSINYYSVAIFESVAAGASASLFATGIYGIVRFVATLIAMALFTDRFGRVSMIVTGGSIMAICMWIIGTLIKVYPAVAGQTSPEPGQYAAIVLIFVWAVAFCFSYAGIPWIYDSEIFPLRIRSLCMAICTATHWAFNLMLAKSTPYMIKNIGYGIWFVFASCTTVFAVLEFFFMKETRGLDLEQIEALYDPTVSLPQIHSSTNSMADASERPHDDEKVHADHVERSMKRA